MHHVVVGLRGTRYAYLASGSINLAVVPSQRHPERGRINLLTVFPSTSFKPAESILRVLPITESKH